MEKVTVDKSGALVVSYPEPQLLIGVEEKLVPEYPDDRMVTHWHEDIELVLALDGGLKSRVDAQEIELSAGDVLFINSRRLHQHYDDVPSSSAMAIRFHPSLILSGLPKNSLARKILRDTGFRWRVLKAGTENAERTAQIMRQLQTVLRERKTLYELDAAMLAVQLIKEICIVCRKEPPSPGNFREENHEKVRGIMSYIYRNFSRKISLDDISGAEEMNRSKCCRLFTYFTNETPVDFLNAYRLETSARLLSGTNRTLKDITAACGFADQSYFGRMFRGKYRCSPGKYRKAASARYEELKLWKPKR
ncbi:MAG: helix-turn-helix transcriptional regulator [Fretibacterium sp.]|nr:helix-turn-helix transcriptional regulator [Fretibacterium sp.]